jgi:hypothetical protein
MHTSPSAWKYRPGKPEPPQPSRLTMPIADSLPRPRPAAVNPLAEGGAGSLLSGPWIAVQRYLPGTVDGRSEPAITARRTPAGSVPSPFPTISARASRAPGDGAAGPLSVMPRAGAGRRECGVLNGARGVRRRCSRWSAGPQTACQACPWQV